MCQQPVLLTSTTLIALLLTFNLRFIALYFAFS